jgi:hypothetical protein
MSSHLLSSSRASGLSRFTHPSHFSLNISVCTTKSGAVDYRPRAQQSRDYLGFKSWGLVAIEFQNTHFYTANSQVNLAQVDRVRKKLNVVLMSSVALSLRSSEVGYMIVRRPRTTRAMKFADSRLVCGCSFKGSVVLQMVRNRVLSNTSSRTNSRPIGITSDLA